ncbi:alpha/beta fold hydrolase [Psychromonas sp.]|uniref:alpha/beta fold hydrolase n=1 Tax=Psychromonas sp. TaxID=1884585 RepID=UPI00356B2049
MKKSLHIKLLLPFLLLFSTPASAEKNMLNNPYGLTTETELNNSFNAQINAFWEKNAISDYFLGVADKKIHTVSIVTGSANAIVISQGRNESVLKYKELAYDLNRQGYDLYLIDHRGQGFSERLGGDQYRGHVDHFQDYVADLNRYISSLELAGKYQNNYLLSHSMGATISTLYLQQYAHPFQASVLFSPMMSINMGRIPVIVAKLITYSGTALCRWFSDKACYIFGGNDFQPKLFSNNAVTTSELRFNSSQNTHLEFPETQLGDASMRWVATSVSAAQQAINNADKINIPVLVVQAGGDTIVTAEGQYQFFENLTNCKMKRFFNIDNAKHEIYLEKDQYRLTALNATLKFFQELQQGKHPCIG